MGIMAYLVHLPKCPKEAHMKLSIRTRRALILLGTLSATAITVACSSNAKPVASSTVPVTGNVHPAAYKTVAQTSVSPVQVSDNSSVAKAQTPKLITYKSRDYGVSFVYRWQYAYMTAKKIVNGDASLKPKSDGDEGQF